MPRPAAQSFPERKVNLNISMSPSRRKAQISPRHSSNRSRKRTWKCAKNFAELLNKRIKHRYESAGWKCVEDYALQIATADSSYKKDEGVRFLEDHHITTLSWRSTIPNSWCVHKCGRQCADTRSAEIWRSQQNHRSRNALIQRKRQRDWRAGSLNIRAWKQSNAKATSQAKMRNAQPFWKMGKLARAAASMWDIWSAISRPANCLPLVQWPVIAK